MCQLSLLTFRCGHDKTFWNYCSFATAKQRRLRQPCQTDQINRPYANSQRRQNCCSTKCCQKNLDVLISRVQNKEKTTNDSNSVAEPGTARHGVGSLHSIIDKLIVGTHRHFTQCLRCHDTDQCFYTIRNEDRLRWNEPLQYPVAPKTPDRIEIRANVAVYEEQIAKWEKYIPVIVDRQVFIDHQRVKRVLSEKELDQISDRFAEALSQFHSAVRTGVRLEDLRALQDHLDIAQPLETDTVFHDVQFVMQTERYDLLSTQMTNIRSLVDQEQAFGRVTDMGHHLYELLLENISMRLSHLMDLLKNWRNLQRTALQESISDLQRDPQAHAGTKKRCLASQMPRKTEQRRSGRSSSGHISSSRVGPSNFNMPMSEEPASMQRDGQRAGAGDYQDGERRRRERSDDSNQSVIGLNDRPLAKKKVKG